MYLILVCCSAIAIFDKVAPLITDVSEGSFDLTMRKKVDEIKNDSFYELMLCVTDKVRILHSECNSLTDIYNSVIARMLF